MSRYIDADALLNTINQNTAEEHNERCAQILEAILYTPTADVVEVVRCRDCKYWQDNNGGYPHELCAWRDDETPDEDDFCSYGERREEE